MAPQALKLNINIEKYYKLCDFKPAYGLIYKEFISTYDFWGYCDIDTIWGNIRLFMPNDILERYYVISARHDYLTGSFTIFKNNDYNLELFRQSRDYIKVYTSQDNYCFDETNYAFYEFGKNMRYSEILTEIESMTHVVKRLEEENKINVYFELQIIEGNPGNLLWNKEKLIFKDKFEILYYHLIKLKEIHSQELSLSKIINNEIRIEVNSID